MSCNPMVRPDGAVASYPDAMALLANNRMHFTAESPGSDTSTQMYPNFFVSPSVAPLCHDSSASPQCFSPAPYCTLDHQHSVNTISPPAPYCTLDHQNSVHTFSPPAPYCTLDHQHSVNTIIPPAPYWTHDDSAHTLSPPSRTATPKPKLQSSASATSTAKRSKDETFTCKVCVRRLGGDQFYERHLQCINCQMAINSVARTIKAPHSDAKRAYISAISTLADDQHSHLEAHRNYLHQDAEEKLRIQFPNGVLEKSSPRPKSKTEKGKVQKSSPTKPSPKKRRAGGAAPGSSFACMYIDGTSEQIHFPLACLIKACEEDMERLLD